MVVITSFLSFIKAAEELTSTISAWSFNIILVSGKFPDCSKRKLVTPIPKKGDVHIIFNYRPISLVNVFKKIFERIVHGHLCDSGRMVFAIKGPMTTNLNEISCTRYQKQVDAIYFNFRKAFDTVHHGILLH